MTLRDDMIAYRARWQAVAEIELREQRAASFESRWQQLNAIVGLAISIGIMKADSSEEGIYQRWAKLKEKAAGQRR
jgi:hypothetical protein